MNPQYVRCAHCGSMFDLNHPHECPAKAVIASPQVPLPQEEPWVAEFDLFKLEEYGKWKIGRAEVKSFIQKTLEADRKAREAEIVAGIEGAKVDKHTTKYGTKVNAALQEIVAKITKGEI